MERKALDLSKLTNKQLIDRYVLFDADTSPETADEESYRMFRVQEYGAEITRRNLWADTEYAIRRFRSLPNLDR